MFEAIISQIMTPTFVYGILLAIATGATVLTVAMPLLEPDILEKRMKSVAVERERIRAKGREALLNGGEKTSLRFAQKQFMNSVVEALSLKKWLTTEKARLQLASAGFRGEPAEISFMFFRLVSPITLFILSIIYVFYILEWDQTDMVKFCVCVAMLYVGIKLPEIYLTNVSQKRQLSLNRAYPNALDLLLICVESGMSIEHSFRKVSGEIGSESVAMAEEFSLATAELSYLPERRIAFENLALRTNLPAMKSLATVLNQSEKYGTPLGVGLRVLAQESRDERMINAEKKAAALPPKLTVPMILFFLPVLICVIITPAIIQVMALDK